MSSFLFTDLLKGCTRIADTFLTFKSRPAGNYTKRQLSMAAAYTVFCHAEFEEYLEQWSSDLTDVVETNWALRKATRPLVHLCTFHEGRGSLTNVPSKDIWNELVISAIMQHRKIIKKNNGIKESNFCALFSPVGFDTTTVDSILLADLSAFGTLRGDHAHRAHRAQLGTAFDPFDRKAKVEGIISLLSALDDQLMAFREVA